MSRRLVEPLVVQTARTRPLGEPDVVAVGSTAYRRLEPTTGREYLHTEAVCTDGYERPAESSGFGTALSDARLDELIRVHDAEADAAAADADQAEAKALAAEAAGDLDEATRQRRHARAARRLAWEYRQYANGYRQRRRA